MPEEKIRQTCMLTPATNEQQNVSVLTKQPNGFHVTFRIWWHPQVMTKRITFGHRQPSSTTVETEGVKLIVWGAIAIRSHGHFFGHNMLHCSQSQVKGDETECKQLRFRDRDLTDGYCEPALNHMNEGSSQTNQQWTSDCLKMNPKRVPYTIRGTFSECGHNVTFCSFRWYSFSPLSFTFAYLLLSFCVCSPFPSHPLNRKSDNKCVIIFFSVRIGKLNFFICLFVITSSWWWWQLVDWGRL